jgi:hypothetical protein
MVPDKHVGRKDLCPHCLKMVELCSNKLTGSMLRWHTGFRAKCDLGAKRPKTGPRTK